MKTSRLLTISLLVVTYSIGELFITNDVDIIKLMMGIKITQQGCATPDSFKVVRMFHRLTYLLKISYATPFSTMTSCDLHGYFDFILSAKNSDR